VTPAAIIYQRRVQVLDRAGQTSVTEACRTVGPSRTTSDRWAGRAQRSGLAGLLAKGRRPPVMATATPPDQVEAVLAEAMPGRPWAPATSSATWPSVGGARRGCSRSCDLTGPADRPSGWPPSPS
jgi:transposase